HIETGGLQPGAFGLNDRPVRINVLRGDVIDRAAIGANAAAKDGGGTPEDIIDEICVVNVQIQQSAARMAGGGAPGRARGEASKAGRQNFSVGFVGDDVF